MGVGGDGSFQRDLKEDRGTIFACVPEENASTVFETMDENDAVGTKRRNADVGADDDIFCIHAGIFAETAAGRRK